MIDINPVAQSNYPTRADVADFFRTLLGNIILLLVLVAAERMFFEKGFYSSLLQHPFWIIVLIAAVHDGLFVGVLVALAATVLMDWPARPAESDITAHYIHVAILPLQWLSAALCIGLFRQPEIRKARLAETEMARLRQVNEVLASDVAKIEAEMTRTQLASLLRDRPQGSDKDIVSRILALQAADRSNLAHLFGSVAELCTSLPVSVIVRNIDGGFEALATDNSHIAPTTNPALDSEQVLKLRTVPAIISTTIEPFQHHPEYVFTVLVGVTSPNHRTLYGAVALLAVDRPSAEQAVSTAQFLACQLVPVLAQLGAPTNATSGGEGSSDNRVRQLFGG